MSAPEDQENAVESTDETASNEGARLPRRERRKRRSRLVARGLGLVSLAIALALFQFTQTATGRNAAIALLQGALDNAVDGSVRIGPVLGGNLVTRLILESFEIADRDGNVFVSMDSVAVEYDPLLLLRKQIRIRRLDAAFAEIRLTTDVEGRWNFERIFRGGSGPEPGTDALAAEGPTPAADSLDPAGADSASVETGGEDNPLRLMLTDVTVRDGLLEVRMPWTEGLEGRERDQAFAEASPGNSIWYSESTDDGEIERVYRVAGLNGRFPEMRIVDPPRPLELQMQDVGGELSMVALPLSIETFSGGVVFGDSIRITIDRFESVRSEVRGSGVMVPGSPLGFQFDLQADPLAFEDLQWLPVPLPETGGGPMSITLASRGETTVVDVSGATVRSEGTRIDGGFRLAVEPTPRFEALDATLQPLGLRWLDDVLDREPTIEGEVSGTLRGSGRIDDLDIVADLTLRHSAGSARAPSVLGVRGGVALVEPYPLRSLELTLRGFEPVWARLVGLDPALPGRVGGIATIDRPDGEILGFAGDVSYLSDAGDVSVLSGTGTVDFGRGSVVDIAIEAAPLSLAALRPWLPDVELVGEVSGPIRARGDLSNLFASADLTTPRGQLSIEGLFVLDGEVPAYDATLTASDLAMDEWIESAPTSRLAVRGRVTGAGLDPATLAATLDMEILPSEVDRASIANSRLRLSVEDGLATIDTLVLEADVGTITGRGEFGVGEERTGRIEFDAVAADLSELNRWFAEGIPGGQAAGAGEIFADFEAAVAEPSPDETVEGVLGEAEARGVVEGRLDDFSVDAEIEARNVRFADWGADSLSATVRLGNPPTTEDLTAHLIATEALVRGVRLDSLALDVDRRPGRPYALDVFARRDSTVQAAASGSLEMFETGISALVEGLRIRLGKLESVLTDPARIVYSDSLIRVDGLDITGPLGRVRAVGGIGRAGEGDLSLVFEGVRVDQLGYLWADRSPIGGTMSATAEIGGTLAEPRFQGSIRVLDPAVAEHRYTSLDARFAYADRMLESALDLTRDGNRLLRVEAGVAADLAFEDIDDRMLDDPIDVRFVADSLPLQLLELRMRGLEQIDGIATGEVSFVGEPGELRYGGSLRIRDGEAWVPDLGVRLLGVTGGAAFRGREATLDSLVLRSSAGGTGRVQGTLDLSSLTDPEFDLELTASVLQAAARRDVQLAVDGRGHLGGRYREPLLTGRFRLRDGDIRQDEVLRERQVLDLSDPQFYGLLDSTYVSERHLLDRFRNPFMNNLRVDVDLDLGPNLWLRSPTLDVELLADALDVRMNRASDEMRIVGTVDLPRGTYRFDRIPPYQQALRITGGTIQFVGTDEFNPNLAISAEYRNRTSDAPVLINVQIGGTLLDTDLQISSSPPMSDTDQLCFLAVGAPCAGSRDTQLGQRLAQEAVLGTLSSGLSSALVGSSGLSYFNLTTINSDARTGGLRGSENLWDTTAVEFGWYASESVFFTFRQPLGGGFPRATMEWRFNPAWSLEAKASSRFDDRLFGFRHTAWVNEQTFGLFLFREWSY